MGNLPISVVIPTKNTEGTLEECLTSVQRNEPAEIIVVDGNSTDSTVEIARKYTEKIYSDEGRGINHAQQIGAEKATQEYIAHVDADIVLPQGTLETLLAELRESDCISMTATLRAASMSTYWERATDWYIRLLQARQGGGMFAAVLRREAILKYKLNSSINVGCDLVLKLKAERDGHKLGTSSTIVYHHHKADMKGLLKQRFRFGWESVQFIAENGPWHGGFWPPLVMLYWIATCLVKGRPDFIPYFIVGGIAGIVGMFVGFAELIRGTLRMGSAG